MENIPTDIQQWFTDTATLSAVILVTITFIKTNIYKLQGIQTLIASFALGTLLSFTGYFLGHFDTIPATIIYGATSALLASGGWDAITSLITKGETQHAKSNNTNTTRTRSKLQ